LPIVARLEKVLLLLSAGRKRGGGGGGSRLVCIQICSKKNSCNAPWERLVRVKNGQTGTRKKKKKKQSDRRQTAYRASNSKEESNSAVPMQAMIMGKNPSHCYVDPEKKFPISREGGGQKQFATNSAANPKKNTAQNIFGWGRRKMGDIGFCPSRKNTPVERRNRFQRVAGRKEGEKKLSSGAGVEAQEGCCPCNPQRWSVRRIRIRNKGKGNNSQRQLARGEIGMSLPFQKKISDQPCCSEQRKKSGERPYRHHRVEEKKVKGADFPSCIARSGRAEAEGERRCLSL